VVAVHHQQAGSVDDCYLVCLSLETGKYLWSSYIGGAASAAQSFGPPNDTPSQLALFQGRLFVMNGRGGIASIDPSDGQIVWFDAYDHSESISGGFAFGKRRYNEPVDTIVGFPKAWQYNPLFISNRSLIAMPSDSSGLFVLDTNSGKETGIASIDEFKHASILLGVQDDIAYLASETDLYAVEFKKLNTATSAQTAVCWSEVNFTSTEENTICARGLVTPDSIFIPTRQRLYQISLRSRRIAAVFPAQGALSDDKTIGNIVRAPHGLLLCGQNGFSNGECKSPGSR
jgi:outer membrane protein assembly factor BamB